MTRVSESLTGRLALLEITPFLANELPQKKSKALWLRGGYPDGGIQGSDRFPQWQRNYLQLIAQRDFPNWGLPAKPETTQRLFHMLAALHGQRWNASQLGQSLHLTHPTINRYLDYLSGAFLVRRLYPFSAKRIAL